MEKLLLIYFEWFIERPTTPVVHGFTQYQLDTIKVSPGLIGKTASHGVMCPFQGVDVNSQPSPAYYLITRILAGGVGHAVMLISHCPQWVVGRPIVGEDEGIW